MSLHLCVCMFVYVRARGPHACVRGCAGTRGACSVPTYARARGCVCVHLQEAACTNVTAGVRVLMCTSARARAQVQACVCVHACADTEQCVCMWAAGMSLCTHPASSDTWGGRGGPRLCPPTPPQPCQTSQGATTRVTPQRPAPHRGWQQGQDPQGFRCRKHLWVTAAPLPVPPWDSDGRGAQPRPPPAQLELRTPAWLCVSPKATGQPGLFLPGDKAPPHHCRPHWPDAGQCREEIQA